PKKNAASWRSNGTSPTNGVSGSGAGATSGATSSARLGCGRSELGPVEAASAIAVQPPRQLADVLVERNVEDLDAAAVPQRPLDLRRVALDRPRLVRQLLLAPDPVKDHAQVPVLHAVPEEEEVARQELPVELRRNHLAQLRLRQVVDV